MDTDQIFWVYVTARDVKEARSLGQALVDARLAACVNIFPEMESIYLWEGEVQQDRETVLIAKTTPERFESLKTKVLELHSYQCPCIVAVPATAGHAPFLRWVRDQVT